MDMSSFGKNGIPRDEEITTLPHSSLNEKEADNAAEEDVQQKANEANRRHRDEEDEHEEAAKKQIDAKRRAVAAKSKKLVEDMSEREHADLDAMEAVQLIVAERVSWLGGWLFDSEPREAEAMRLIEQQFDFLGLLAEKLADPELEVAPEVEGIYVRIQEAVELDVDTCVDGESIHPHIKGAGDEVLTVLEHTLLHDTIDSTESLPSDDKVIHEEHSTDDHNASVAFAITSLALACRHHLRHNNHSTVPDAITLSDNSTTTTTTTATTTTVSPSPHVSSTSSKSGAPPSSAIPPTPRHPVAQHVQRPLVVPPRASAGTASIIAGTLAVAVRESSELVVFQREPTPLPNASLSSAVAPVATYNQTETSGGNVIPSLNAAPAAPRSVTSQQPVLSQNEGVRASLAPRHSPVLDAPPPPMPSSGELTPSRLASPRDQLSSSNVDPKPIENWSVHELLRVAETIPLGHGQYLRRAFEHGEIDKPGLVKVVKAWSGGHSFMPVFAAEKQRVAVTDKKVEPISDVAVVPRQVPMLDNVQPVAKPESDKAAAAPTVAKNLSSLLSNLPLHRKVTSTNQADSTADETSLSSASVIAAGIVLFVIVAYFIAR